MNQLVGRHEHEGGKEILEATLIGPEQQKDWPGLDKKTEPRQKSLIRILRPRELARRLHPGAAAREGEKVAQVGALNVGGRSPCKE